jgi:serine/threonine-protein kinase
VRVCAVCSRSTEESGRYCPDCGAELSPAASLVGRTLDGQFVIEGVLGGGAFGSVYRGRQVGLDRPVAIKVPTHEIAVEPVMMRRFAREALAAARVRHPGVVTIYAVGELADRRPYLAMELIEGEPLDRIVADGPVTALRALGIARSIASALGETHAAGVVHRDLKPSNIIWRVDRNGDDRITLVDFGIAACKPGTAEATRLTTSGMLGTPHYMSPEQAHGDEVDARTDLYALGCVVFELVTATTPFDGSSFEVLLAHMGRPAPRPSERNPLVPEAIDRLCESLLAKKPDDRPASADELVATLDRLRRELATASPALASTVAAPRAARTVATRADLPSGRSPRRGRRWVLGVAAAVIAIASAGVGALVLGRGRSAAAQVVDATSPEPEDQPNGPTHPGAGRRDVFSDDGEIVLHALVPDPIVAGQEIRPHLEIKNKLGQPIVAAEIVVTIADSHGGAKGLTARPHGDQGGHYAFAYTFPEPGHYVVRVFPPSVDSAFEIPVDATR